MLAHRRRDLGVAIIGRSGTGKSSLLEHLILADLAQGTPGVVIDPHGKLAERVITLAPRAAASRIVLLEPSVTQPFGLNLLACREAIDDEDDPVSWAADSVVATVKKLYGEQDEYLPRLEHYLDLAARTLIPNSGTLADAPRLFRDDAFRKACLARLSDRDVREDWRLYDSLRATDQITHIEAVINRLSRLLRPKVIQGMVGSPRTTVPFEEVLDGDAMIILSLPSERLTPERCNFIGAMVLCALADRVFARSVTRQVHRLHLYLDEYQRFATATTAELLTQGRKYGVGVTLAHQGRGQIGDAGVQDAELQAGTLIILAVTRQDADVLAGELPVTQRDEWIEQITVTSGTEPELVPTRQPGQHLVVHGHRAPSVAAAARQLFEVTTERPGKLLMISWEEVVEWPRVTVSPDDPAINQLLVDVMDGKLTKPEQLASCLLPIVYSFSKGGMRRSGAKEDSLSEVAGVYSGRLTPVDYHFKRVDDDWRPQDVPEVTAQLSSWLDVYLAHGQSPESVRRPAYDKADNKLYEYARHRQETEPAWILWATKGGGKGSLCDSARQDQPKFLAETVKVMGQRLHALITLCDGLAADPILVPSGQHKPALRQQLVVHPRQPEQDARNELAGRLVNPPQEYVAHVRLAGGGYHQVRLSEPVSGPKDLGQLGDIRSCSRRHHAVATAEVEASSVLPADGPAVISRYHPDEE